MNYLTIKAKNKRPSTIGLLIVMASITMLFGTFISSFFVLKIRLATPLYIPPKVQFIGIINTILILLSSYCLFLTEKKYKNRDIEEYYNWLIITIFLGLLFIIGQLILWFKLSILGIPITFGQLSDMFYLLSGVHGIHLITGLILFLWLKSFNNYFKSDYSIIRVRNIVLFWHFLTIIWIIIFFIILF